MYVRKVDTVIACVVWNVKEYGAAARKVMEDYNAQCRKNGVRVPTPYANSTISRCCVCDVRIAVGPRQRELITVLEREEKAFKLSCLLCTAVLGAKSDNVFGLGGEADQP